MSCVPKQSGISSSFLFLLSAVALAVLAACSLPSKVDRTLVPAAETAWSSSSDSKPVVTSFPVDGVLIDIAADGGGGVWGVSNASVATSKTYAWIKHISANGHVDNYRVPTFAAGVTNLAVTSNGIVYFSEMLASKIGVVRNGSIREYRTPTKHAYPIDVIAASGRVWFAEGGGHYNNFGSFEAVANIATSGRITEYRIATPRGQAGAGADYMQDDHDGGVWFVGTRHHDYCEPVPCPEFIGQVHATGTVRVLRVPDGIAAFFTYSDANGLWFGEPYSRNLAYISLAGRAKQYPVRRNMADIIPFGSIGGNVWTATSNPFTVFSATPYHRSQFIPIDIPGTGPFLDKRVIPVAGGGHIWMFNTMLSPQSDPQVTQAYRYEPQSNELDSVLVTKRRCGPSFNAIVYSGSSLWGADSCDPGRIWSVTFPKKPGTASSDRKN